MLATKPKSKPARLVAQPAKPVTVNSYGVATAGFQELQPPMAAKLKISVRIQVGWFAKKGRYAAGWRCVASYQCRHMGMGPLGQSAGLSYSAKPFDDRDAAIVTAVCSLLSHFRLEGEGMGNSSGQKQANFRAAAESLDRWLQCHVDRAADCPPPLLTFDSKQSGPIGTHRKLLPSPDAVIDVASAPAEKLSTEERRELKAIDAKIERGAQAFLEMAVAYREVRDKRLYRYEYSSIEDWAWKEHHCERSVLFRLIRFADIHEQTSAIADKYSLRLTNEAQFRAVEKLHDVKDFEDVYKRASKVIVPDENGERIPTAKILSQAVRKSLERAFGTAPKKHRADNGLARGPESIATDDSRCTVRPQPADPEYRLWNGQSRGYAPILHELRELVTDAVEAWADVEGFTTDLAALLHSMAAEFSNESTLLHGLTHSSPRTAARRAK
ncbi:MAG: hypothetical protein ACLP9L_41640 [Thermoguttaceae bacterium]